MELVRGIKIVDLALLVNDALIIADTQIGYEEALNKQGVMIPRFQWKDILARLSGIFDIANPKTIIVNGDIKHEFGSISDTEWRNTLRLIDFLSSKARLVLIKGNHDIILEPIARKRSACVKDYFVLGDVYVCHGHKVPENSDFESAKTIIIGHEHPAVNLREKGRVEKFKCFLKGKYKGKTLIVQPSFNLVTEGTDILSEKLLSPFLKQRLDDFEVYVADEETLYFGKVSGLV